MEEQLKQIIEAVEKEIAEVSTFADFEQFKARISGPNGSFTGMSKQIAQLPVEERPTAGKLINIYKQRLQAIWESTLGRLEAEEMARKIGPAVDPSLESPEPSRGSSHILVQVREEIVSVLRKIGFVVADGPELETEYYCFDALNTPKDHPARDLQDTYYLKKQTPFGNVSQREDERYLLRTHTSSVQIRTMLEQEPPIRIIAPGRCFRRDTADATHSANFHQIEALYVDKGVTIRDLKADLDYLFRSLLGPDAETRFRPHYFSWARSGPSGWKSWAAAWSTRRFSRKWATIQPSGRATPSGLGWNGSP
jgi:phenylalanyl-tRNA synthetase alpha chain